MFEYFKNGLFLLSILFMVVPVGELWAGKKEPLVVAAASDLRFAFPEIAREFEKDVGIKVIFSFGSTGMFTQQIENGAPFDLFAAANAAYIERLKRQGLIVDDTVQLYAMGRIVLVVNRQSGVKATELKNLLNPEIRRISIANPNHAPYGLAAKEALINSGLWQKLKDKLVFGENVRQALQFVQTGNAEAGIVALSIADVSEVSHTLLDEELHNPLRQTLAVIKESKNKESAGAFISYINGPKGRAVMRKYGFILPGEAFDTDP